MNQDQLKAIKTDVLSMGEQTKSYIFGEIRSDGAIGWRYGGNIIDSLFLVRFVGRCLDKEFDANTSREPPKT